MANVKISELAVNSSPSASATLVGVDGGETVQIPITEFVTKDDNGNVKIREGSKVTFYNKDESDYCVLECEEDGTLSLNGNTVATVDDIPSGGLGCTQTPSEGLAFSLMSDGNSYGVSGIGTCADTDIIIPSTYEGKPVTSINLNAFEECSNLTSIVIPDSVTAIGEKAFFLCSSLKSVTIPNSVTSIGNSAFMFCSNLSDLKLSNNLISIGKQAFYQCDSLTEIVIPNSVTSIDANAFAQCDNLKTVIIPASVTTINNRAFHNCPNLTIYCEAPSKPTGWTVLWNESNCPVVWGAVTDILDANNKFVTKDENGNVTVETLQADDGIKCVGTLDVKEGYTARFWSNDNSKYIPLCCDDNGKLSLNGKAVATVDDIPSGGSPMMEVSYFELRDMRDRNALIPGMFYKINDYLCTTNQEGTGATNHSFYIIVQALSHDTLSEIAKADIITNGEDDYFIDAGANVSAWELKYCLDNDTTRFAWAMPDYQYLECVEGVYGIVNIDEICIRWAEMDGTCPNENYHYAWIPQRYTLSDEMPTDSRQYIYTETEYVNPYTCDFVVFGQGYDDWIERGVSDFFTSALEPDPMGGGRGVIYYMKDEHGNECPYDFKNIQFKRYAITGFNDDFRGDDSLKESLLYDETENPYMYGIKDILYGETIPRNAEIDEDLYVWCYTFTSFDRSSEDSPVMYDMSLCKSLSTTTVQDGIADDTGMDSKDNCSNNIIKPYYKEPTCDDGSTWNNGRLVLSNNVFYGLFYDRGYWEDYKVNYCYNNILGDMCYNNTFGYDCYNIVFGSFGYHNTFCRECYNNKFGNYCSSNIFANNCCNNTANNTFQDNTFGAACYDNSFQNNNVSNTFEHSCWENNFGNRVGNIIFGYHCRNNNISNECSNIVLGSWWSYNVIEPLCSGLHLNHCDSVQKVIIRSGVKDKVFTPHTGIRTYTQIFKPSDVQETEV